MVIVFLHMKSAMASVEKSNALKKHQVDAWILTMTEQRRKKVLESGHGNIVKTIAFVLKNAVKTLVVTQESFVGMRTHFNVNPTRREINLG